MASSKPMEPIVLDDHIIPVTLYKEFRGSIRFSITRKGLVIRCPVFAPSGDIVNNATKWCSNLLVSKPAALQEFKTIDYFKLEQLELLGDKYHLNIDVTSSLKDKISWNSRDVKIGISKQYTPHQAAKSIKDLITKFAIRRYTPVMEQRVRELNKKHFNVLINKVRLKNNRTNWGSCSSKGNINLSVRLLKAPDKVIDYVIIHELAHRIEMNHSKKFWNVVAQACPSYKTHEKWLKDHGHLCHL